MASWCAFQTSKPMTQGQWQRVKEITADAFEQEPSLLAAFVANASGDDDEVRDEALRLLVDDANSVRDILSSPLLDLHQLLRTSSASEATFAPGQEIKARFLIERFLGRGGMGEVYAARDLELQESVALKTIRSDVASSAQAIERFKQEVKESRRITHSCVCRVYDLFSHERANGETVWFLTMELLEGQALRDTLASRGAMLAAQAIPLIGDIVAALSAAHEMGIVHRDLKPGNVMLVKQGTAHERAVITDFGLALDISREASSGAAAADGTPAYMSPEQAAGNAVGFQADQYALGMVMCEMLTGSRPALSRTSELEARGQLELWLDQQPRRRIDASRRRIIRRCLEFRPECRFSHVREILSLVNRSSRKVLAKWSAAAAAVVCAAAAILAITASEDSTKVQGAVRITPESGLSSAAAISRDGKWIAYSSDRGQPGKLEYRVSVGCLWTAATANYAPGRRERTGSFTRRKVGGLPLRARRWRPGTSSISMASENAAWLPAAGARPSRRTAALSRTGPALGTTARLPPSCT